MIIKPVKFQKLLTFKESLKIPEGLNLQIFLEASIDEKVKMIPTAFLDEIKLE